MSIIPITPNGAADVTQMLSAVIDTAGSVILGLRPDHTIFAWNRAAEALYQTSRAEAFDQNYVDRFIAPEHRAAVSADIREVLAGKITRGFEDDSLLPDGRRRTLIWNVTRVLDAAGAPVGIVAIGQDISERKEAEERFRLVFEHAQEGLLLSDHTGVIDCNPAALAMLGLSAKAQLIGRRPADFSPPFQPDGTPSDVKSKLLGAETAESGAIRFEWVHARTDGVDVPVNVSVRHAELEGRRISVIAWHDLTHRRQMEQARAELQERLDLAQKMEAVGQLAGGVAHDFNNLLTAMRNAIELAQGALPPGSEAHRDLDLALDAAGRAGGLTRQLLAFSRSQPVRPDLVELGLLLRETVQLLRTTLPSTVEVLIEAPAQPITVRADRSQLEQVVMNLVLNARDALRGAGRLRLSLAVHEDRKRVELRVIDDGVGMSIETQRRIFEPFFTTKPMGEGTGLGLSVVYGAVQQAGGTIRVESAPGVGSTFVIALPLAEADAGAPIQSGARAGGAGRRLLLVDDEDVVRSTTQRLLQRLGWEVVAAADGEEGLALFEAQRHAFDIVVSDVRMPRMDGLRMVARMREQVPTLPVLLVSGYDSVEGDAGDAARALPFLAKPFDLAALAAAVELACVAPSAS